MEFRCTRLNERVDNRPKFIIGSRQQGKTILLIKETSETDGVIVCQSCRAANYISMLAKNLGYSISEPITYGMWWQYFGRGRKQKCYFDEYGMQLVSALQKRIERFRRGNVKTVIIDEESISQINDILGELKVCDMNGEKLRLKIEICEED